METKTAAEKVISKKEKLCVNIEQIMESDISLPDYYGDIVKVLGCSTRVNIFSCSVTGDKGVIDGSAEIRTLYVNGEGKTEILEHSCPFNRTVDLREQAAGDILTAEAVSEQITCRAVNSRRAEIRGTVTLKVCCFGICETEIITKSEKSGYHFLEREESGSFLQNSALKSFTLSQTEDLPQGVKSCKIYRTSVIPSVNEVKTIKNKMMIKGSVSADIVYMTDGGDFISQRVTMPLNQIADMDLIDESSQCCVRLTADSVDAKLTPDTPQSPPKLEITVILSAFTDAYKTAVLKCVSEAYSVRKELVCEKERIKCISSSVRVNENYTVSSKMDFSSCKGKEIADAAVKKIRTAWSAEGGSIVCKGNIHYGFIVVTADSEKVYLERIADFEYRKQTGTEAGNYEFSPVISVNAVSCSVDEDGKANINAELHFDGCIHLYNGFEAVTSVTEGRDIERCPDGVITIYYGSKGERLWDIARERGSSVECIKAANGIAEDELAENKMLIFPLE